MPDFGRRPGDKPDLFIRSDDLTVTAVDLAAIIARSGRVFDRGGPVQIFEQSGEPPSVVRLTPDSAVILAHQLTRPVVLNSDGKPAAKTLSLRVANLYLSLLDWGLQPLRGVTTAPLLSEAGDIRTVTGYEPNSGFWCVPPQGLSVPDQPTLEEARDALAHLRATFRTFPFADSLMIKLDGFPCVDPATSPGQDESAFLAGLLTAICRPSLPLAPGLLITAPAISGAGSGKGILVRAIASIAFGIEPRAFTAGRDMIELDKRIGSALIEATPVLFLDNLNGEALRSDLLAAVLTEPRVDLRPLGSSRMVPLCTSACVMVTGNGLSISEDLARRFVVIKLDARVDDPEARRFPAGFLRGIAARRAALLSECLTILRWGRQNLTTLRRGRPVGSFEDWAEWVRDPLLTLGCVDPIERLRELKAEDPMRRMLAEVFTEWNKAHQDRPLQVARLSPHITRLIDPQDRGRQFVASFLQQHIGTRAAGFVLTAQKAPGKWGATTYAIKPVDEMSAPMPPMPPMLS